LAYPPAAIAYFTPFIWQSSVKILLDVNWRPVFWLILTPRQTIQQLFKQIDFLKLEEEAEWLFETTDPGAITYRLDSVVVVTAGERLCLLPV